MPRSNSAAVNSVREVLSAPVPSMPSAEAEALVRQLKVERKFSYARRLLARIWPSVSRDDPRRLWLGQQFALCTYKDTDLPSERRLARALELLRVVQDPDSVDASQETLGLAGAIWKRSWEVTGRKQDLEASLAYYQAGARRGIADDQGYTAVNAAFVLDLLAREDERQPGGARGGEQSANLRRDEARGLRRSIVETLKVPIESTTPPNWWLAATVAEARFGLGEYKAAEDLLVAALKGNPPEWELESTARQLAALARLRSADPVRTLTGSDPSHVVGLLVGSDAAIRGAFAGKVGLALSGGGFRASLFHIGVLARLAELDLLRHVEVISCVSGGSILGAHYYLKLQRLLKTTPDGQIRREHYITLVRELERDFLAGVQRNPRTRMFAEFTTNIRLLFQPGFTRTARAGELFEKELYSRMDGNGDVTDRRERHMSDLLIEPMGEVKNFHPAQHNWRRGAKVPMLVLNATTLNTGHAWQFTATWMGEPPGDIDADIDGNYRLRRLYYDEAPEPPYDRARCIRLGRAVAASAAVPGIFEPVDLPGLYERPSGDGASMRPISVRLVDGGVHDNQGTASLLDQECTVLLVSDASGQMDTADHPKASPFAVLARTSSVQGARIRTAEYDDVSARKRAHALGGLLFVHLKRGLGVQHLDWRGCDEPHAKFGDLPEPAGADQKEHTFHGVKRVLQRSLAKVRTDLDSFSDAEAYALMASGYRMTAADAANQRCGLRELTSAGAPVTWAFQQIDSALAGAAPAGSGGRRLERLLEVARNRAFKIWRLNVVLSVVALLLAVAALAVVGIFAFQHRDATIPFPHLTVRRLAYLLLVVLAGAVGGTVAKRLLELVEYRKTYGQLAGGIVLGLGGFLVARVHLWVFDRLYLRWGGIRHFQASANAPNGQAPPPPAGAAAPPGVMAPSVPSLDTARKS